MGLLTAQDEIDRISYCLLKQLPNAYQLVTTYGDFILDVEMRAAVTRALTPILESRAAELQAGLDKGA